MATDPADARTSLSFDVVDNPSRDEIDVLEGGLIAFNVSHAGPHGYRPLAAFLRDEERAIVGGISAATFWAWLVIELVWIDERFRGFGYGDRLLTMVEEEAVRRGCTQAYVDTHAFQAPGFYAKHGYRVFGELPDFPAGFTKYFMVKRLVEETP